MYSLLQLSSLLLIKANCLGARGNSTDEHRQVCWHTQRQTCLQQLQSLPLLPPTAAVGLLIALHSAPLAASKPSPSNDFKVITKLIISACISHISVLENRLIFFRVVLIKRGTSFNLNFIIPRILLKNSDLLLYYLYQGYPNHEVFDFALKIAFSVMLLCFAIT